MSSFLIRGHNTYPLGHYLKMAEIDFSCMKYYWINMCLPRCNDNNWHLSYPVFKITPFSISKCVSKQKTVSVLISVVWFAAFFPFPHPFPSSFPLKQLSYARSLFQDEYLMLTHKLSWSLGSTAGACACVGTLTTKRHFLTPDFFGNSSIFCFLKVLGGIDGLCFPLYLCSGESNLEH